MVLEQWSIVKRMNLYPSLILYIKSCQTKYRIKQKIENYKMFRRKTEIGLYRVLRFDTNHYHHSLKEILVNHIYKG